MGSRAEFNGSKGFLGNWNCGHVITDTVIKELSTDKKIQNCPVCHAEYKEIDLIRVNPIHPDHLKQIKHQFHLRRKQRHLKAKLNRHYKKDDIKLSVPDIINIDEEMKLLKSREIQIKKEEVSSSADDSSDDSTSSCSSSDDSSDKEKFKPEQKYKPSSTKRSRRRSSSPEDVKPKIVNSTPIEIDSDPITIQSSDEEAKVKEERIKYIQEREKRHRKQIKEFERIIKKRREEASDSDCVVLSD